MQASRQKLEIINIELIINSNNDFTSFINNLSKISDDKEVEFLKYDDLIIDNFYYTTHTMRYLLT